MIQKQDLYEIITTYSDKELDRYLKGINHQDLSIQDEQGNVILHQLINSGYYYEVSFLLKRNYIGRELKQQMIKIPNNYGDTSLHLAVKKQNTDLVNLLLSFFNRYEFAELFQLENDDNQTVFSLAKGKGLDLINDYVSGKYLLPKTLIFKRRGSRRQTFSQGLFGTPEYSKLQEMRLESITPFLNDDRDFLILYQKLLRKHKTCEKIFTKENALIIGEKIRNYYMMFYKMYYAIYVGNKDLCNKEALLKFEADVGSILSKLKAKIGNKTLNEEETKYRERAEAFFKQIEKRMDTAKNIEVYIEKHSGIIEKYFSTIKAKTEEKLKVHSSTFEEEAYAKWLNKLHKNVSESSTSFSEKKESSLDIGQGLIYLL